MSVLDELRNYRDSKGNKGYNLVKRNFFTKLIELIENNQLTVATLTDELARLSPEERSQLFFRRRNQRPSPYCESAQWVLTLYHVLNVPMDDLSLAIIVTEGITPKNQIKLKKQVYQKWEKNCFLPRNIRSLEHELKAHLGLNRRDNKRLSLADIMKRHFEANGFESLEEMLTHVDNKVPRYVPELINKLYLHYKENETLLAELLDIGRRNPNLSVKISSSNTIIAAAMVEQSPQIFFKLSSSMQHTVLTQLESTGTNDIAENLFKQSAADAFFSSVDSDKFLHLLANGDYLEAASKEGHDAHSIYNAFHQNIVNKLSERKDHLVNQDIKKIAINAIDAYLREEPNTHKTRFFKELKKVILSQGLTTELLEAHLQATDRKKLFAKWSGHTHSRAAALIGGLYSQANFGNALEESQIKTMFHDGHLPKTTKKTSEKQQDALINERINTILRQPEQARTSALGKAIAREIDYYRSFYRLSQHVLANDQFAREAVYQNYLIKKGLDLAQVQTSPVFDPQGHVLVRIELTQEDLNAIVSKMMGKEIHDASKEKLAALLGVESISLTTLCNLDITVDQELNKIFKARILGEAPSENLIRAVNALLSSADRSSIIALQEEMTMHVSLSLRALENIIDATEIGTYNKFTSDEYQRLMVEINTLVLERFRSVLDLSFADKNHLNLEKLNHALDKARQDLAPESRKILVNMIMEKIRTDQRDAFIADLVPALDKHFFTSTTATGLDYLRTDASNHTAVRISATDFTAHDKGLGSENQALRILARNHYNAAADNAVTPYKIKTQEARVPSIATRNSAHRSPEVVRDIAAKLKHSYDVLSAKNPGYQGPMVYNLLTSLHTKAYDNTLFEKKNKQRKSAAQILLGAHLFNREQLKRGQPYMLIFVQNIPVNQHSKRLDNKSFDAVTAEATIMTDMALMSTLNHYQALFPPTLSRSIARTYKQAHANYLEFLPDGANGILYFKDSLVGKQVIENFEKKKAAWGNAVNQLVPEKDLQSLVVQALFKIMISDLHHNKQFGMLIQSLSIFVEPLSQGGCKSANERYQAVAGRVELLKSIRNGEEPSLQKTAVLTVLNNFVLGYAPIEHVQEALDVAYNQHNLQGSAAVFSEEDQGASSKVVATANKSNPGKITEFTNTNVAETGYLTRLSQKFSSGMQAHKAHLASWFKEYLTSDSVLSAEKSSFSY